jgi:hypothetical protein
VLVAVLLVGAMLDVMLVVHRVMPVVNHVMLVMMDYVVVLVVHRRGVGSGNAGHRREGERDGQAECGQDGFHGCHLIFWTRIAAERSSAGDRVMADEIRSDEIRADEIGGG